MEAENQALKAEVASLRERIESLEASAKASAKKPASAKKEPVAKGAIQRKEVNYGLIPKGALLRFTVGTKAKTYGIHEAVFHDANTITPKDIAPPAGKTSFATINAFATACLKIHQAERGLKAATINVFDKATQIVFQKGGEWVRLNTIQTISRGETAPAAAVGGGGSVAAVAVEAEATAEVDIPASQDSVLVCANCGTEECSGGCADAVDELDEQMGGLAVAEEEEDEAVGGDLQDMDVKGTVCLYNAETGVVYSKTANGTPGAKVSDYKEGKHVWEWTNKKIGDTFFRVNHFNYVKQTDKAGKAWVGIYDPATKTVAPTPAPEDF